MPWTNSSKVINIFFLIWDRNKHGWIHNILSTCSIFLIPLIQPRQLITRIYKILIKITKLRETHFFSQPRIIFVPHLIVFTMIFMEKRHLFTAHSILAIGRNVIFSWMSMVYNFFRKITQRRPLLQSNTRQITPENIRCSLVSFPKTNIH